METEHPELSAFQHLLETYPQQTRRVLNLLTESPFFYRSDAPNDFDFITFNKPVLTAWFRMVFGWELMGTGACFRLCKDHWENRELKWSQRSVFRLTKRNECLAFLTLLIFFEKRTASEGYSPDDPEPFRFRYKDFFDFAKEQFQTLLRDAEGHPKLTDKEVQNVLRELWPQLIDYRFIAYLEPERDDGTPTEEEKIYTALPALWSYNTTTAAEILRRWQEEGNEDA